MPELKHNFPPLNPRPEYVFWLKRAPSGLMQLVESTEYPDRELLNPGWEEKGTLPRFAVSEEEIH